MSFDIKKLENKLLVKVIGEFNAILAEELQNSLEVYKGISLPVVFDLDETTTIASSGLRVIVFAEERIAAMGDVSIINAKKIVLEVIKLSGIDDFVKLR